MTTGGVVAFRRDLIRAMNDLIESIDEFTAIFKTYVEREGGESE